MSAGPFPPGAEQRIAYFAELAAQALANAQAREELAASRARIVQAGDAERRRLERNLHDGAQQRLVSLALMLRLAARRHPEDADLESAGRGARARAAGAARAGPRHPPRGADRARAGTGGARGRRPGADARSSCDVELEARLAGPGRGRRVLRRQRGADERRQVRRRRPSCACRSGAPRSTACGSRWSTTASAAPTRSAGSGLRGLADRVEALGGRIDVDSPPGIGTTLRADIPV